MFHLPQISLRMSTSGTVGNTMNLVFEIIFAGRAIVPMGTVSVYVPPLAEPHCLSYCILSSWMMVIYALSVRSPPHPLISLLHIQTDVCARHPASA